MNKTMDWFRSVANGPHDHSNYNVASNSNQDKRSATHSAKLKYYDLDIKEIEGSRLDIEMIAEVKEKDWNPENSRFLEQSDGEAYSSVVEYFKSSILADSMLEVEENKAFHQSFSVLENALPRVGYNSVVREEINKECSVYDKMNGRSLDLMACQVSMHGWTHGTQIDSHVARRLRDFQFARLKRYMKYGNSELGGIYPLYDHLRSIRQDITWVEEVSRRRLSDDEYLPWSEYEEAVLKDLKNHRPYFTYSIIVLFTICLLVSIVKNDWSVEDLQLNPLLGPSAATLIRTGAKETSLILNRGEGWRLISSIFLNCGFIQLLFNLIVLGTFGSAVEHFHGTFFTAGAFITTGVGGVLISSIILPNSISVGGSGGAFGFLGVVLFDIKVNWFHLCCFHGADLNGVDMNFVYRKLQYILFIFFFGFILGLMPYQDNFINIIAFIYGFLFSMALALEFIVDFEEERDLKVISSAEVHANNGGLLLLLLCLLMSTLILFSGNGESFCPICESIGCVSFPRNVNKKSELWWYCDLCDASSADLQIDITTGLYSKLELLCPYGNSVKLYMDGSDINNSWVDKNLPEMCRQHCHVN